MKKTASPAQAAEAASGLPPQVQGALGELVEAAKEGGFGRPARRSGAAAGALRGR